jgi:hypothetical protein
MIAQLVTVFLLVIACSATAQEEVYRWTDSQGRTHFGNRPPADVQAKRINLHSQPAKVIAGGKVYTWIDEQGNKHYGDHPPTNTQAEQVDTDIMPMSTIRATEFRPGERQLLDQLEQRNRSK